MKFFSKIFSTETTKVTNREERAATIDSSKLNNKSPSQRGSVRNSLRASLEIDAEATTEQLRREIRRLKQV
jgi:hypothetical protein